GSPEGRSAQVLPLARITELEYVADSPRRFQSLLGRPWSVFLDSGRGGSRAGRFDILTAEPYVTLTTRGNVTEIRSADSVFRSTRDPLDLLKEQLGPPAEPERSGPAGRGEGPAHDGPDVSSADLPFRGGAIGWFAYDLGRRFERLPA